MRASRSPRPAWLSWVLSFAALALVTVVLLLLRGTLGKAHIALAYLLVVLGGSAAGGGVLGVALSAAAFLCFNYLFLPPYSTLVIADPLDWLVLVAFLVTGVVAAQLLSRAQQRAELARRRTQEVERLASLGAETLNVGRAEDALGAIAGVIRGALGVARCEILVPGDQPQGRGHGTRHEDCEGCRGCAWRDDCRGEHGRERDGVPYHALDRRSLAESSNLMCGSCRQTASPASHSRKAAHQTHRIFK